jgi:hypothetical protein
MIKRLLSTGKKIKNADLVRFETGNWMEHIEKYKRNRLGKGKFFYNNIPTYNEGEALNELGGKMPGIELDKNNRIINKTNRGRKR